MSVFTTREVKRSKRKSSESLQYATYNNHHKATHLLLFRDERNQNDVAWLQIRRTLKKILGEATNNCYRKRHNKNHLPASWQFTWARVNLQLKSSRQKLAAEVVKTELNELPTELINIFNRSVNQPLFPLS